MADFKLELPALRSAGLGEQFANDLLAVLRADPRSMIRVDFASVEIMTPSYANALVMTLLQAFPLSDLKARCEFANRSSTVIEVMNLAVTRFQRGIRLSGQKLPNAA